LQADKTNQYQVSPAKVQSLVSGVEYLEGTDMLRACDHLRLRFSRLGRAPSVCVPFSVSVGPLGIPAYPQLYSVRHPPSSVSPSAWCIHDGGEHEDQDECGGPMFTMHFGDEPRLCRRNVVRISKKLTVRFRLTRWLWRYLGFCVYSRELEELRPR